MPPTDDRHNALHTSLRDAFTRATSGDVRVDAQQAVYATGDEDDSLYLIEFGQVKLSMSSAEGKDCLLAIYTAGEMFGESCFAPAGRRFENATSMQASVLRRVSRRDFMAEVERAGSWDALLRHLASRLEERQNAVFDAVTMESERRLAKVLLGFAEKLATIDGPYLRLDQRISHEELSQIVGTTRPRVTAFMQKFRKLGLIETTGRAISVHGQRMRDFVEHE